MGRGEEAAELQAAVEGGAGRVVVYEDLACPSPGEEGGALVPRPFVVVAAALYPGRWWEVVPHPFPFPVGGEGHFGALGGGWRREREREERRMPLVYRVNHRWW